VIHRANSRVSPQNITFALIGIGLGMTLGNELGGRAAARSLRATLIGSLIGLIVILATLAAMLTSFTATVALLFVWGALCFAVVPTIQMRVMSAAHGGPGLASSINIGAFNLGSGWGAVVGGLAIRESLDSNGVIWASAIVFAIPLLFTLFSSASSRAPVSAH
jgi:DHA1 family inner membrane transport protein